MKSKFIFSWALFFDAFRSASGVMILQGVMCLLFCDSDQLVDWGKGSVVIGVLFWAGWAVAVHLGVGKIQNQDMHDANF
jgi:hypothetical protein